MLRNATTKGSKPYHVYQIYACMGAGIAKEEWSIYKRYSQFEDLHTRVKEIFKKDKLDFPRKKALKSHGPKFVEERRKGLEQYIRSVVLLCLRQKGSPVVRNPCKKTMCTQLPFLAPKLSGIDAARAAMADRVDNL